jgi:hypothetical protein
MTLRDRLLLAVLAALFLIAAGCSQGGVPLEMMS